MSLRISSPLHCFDLLLAFAATPDEYTSSRETDLSKSRPSAQVKIVGLHDFRFFVRRLFGTKIIATNRLFMTIKSPNLS